MPLTLRAPFPGAWLARRTDDLNGRADHRAASVFATIGSGGRPSVALCEGPGIVAVGRIQGGEMNALHLKLHLKLAFVG